MNIDLLFQIAGVGILIFAVNQVLQKAGREDIAVLSSVAAFMLYNYSTSVISAVRSSSFSNIITVVTVLAGVLILKEKKCLN